jgi:glutamine synthetase
MHSSINELLAWFSKEHGLTPVIGYELELYASDAEVMRDLPPNIQMEAEVGENQFEIKFLPSRDVVALAQAVEDIKSELKDRAHRLGARVYFEPKPFDDQPSSGLHVHLNFLDDSGANVFQKRGAEETEILLHTVGGLLATMREFMHVFAPHEQAYLRYEPSMYTPSTLSWGGNNRTTALRIPPWSSGARRIEHRVPCSDADVRAVTHAILHGAHVGIRDRITPPAKIYGNAFDIYYQAPRLSSQALYQP